MSQLRVDGNRYVWLIRPGLSNAESYHCVRRDVCVRVIPTKSRCLRPLVYNNSLSYSVLLYETDVEWGVKCVSYYSNGTESVARYKLAEVKRSEV